MRLLAGLCLGLALAPAFAETVRFPGNPTSYAQCDAAKEQSSALARRAHEEGVAASKRAADVGRQRQASCRSGMRDYWGCIDPYDRNIRALQGEAMQHFKERDRIYAEERRLNATCRDAAKVHVQREEQQQRMARESQQRQQRYQQDLERQRAQAEAKSEALRRAQAAELELANRRAAQPARNEPRVIADIPPSPYNPATRNEPRQVQTPQMAAQARAEQERQAEVRRQEEAQVLRDAVGSLARGQNPGRRVLEAQLNPQNHQDPRLDDTVDGVRGVNRAMNRGGRVVVGIQNEAFNAAGAANNNALGQLDGALASTDASQARPAPPAIALPRRESSGAEMFQQAIAEQARPAGAGIERASPAPATDCQQAYDAQEDDFKRLMSGKPARVDTVPSLQNLMYMTRERVKLLDSHCRDHPKYGERGSTQATYDQAERSCRGVASSASYCTPRRGW